MSCHPPGARRNDRCHPRRTCPRPGRKLSNICHGEMTRPPLSQFASRLHRPAGALRWVRMAPVSAGVVFLRAHPACTVSRPCLYCLCPDPEADDRKALQEDRPGRLRGFFYCHPPTARHKPVLSARPISRLKITPPDHPAHSAQKFAQCHAHLSPNPTPCATLSLSPTVLGIACSVQQGRARPWENHRGTHFRPIVRAYTSAHSARQRKALAKINRSRYLDHESRGLEDSVPVKRPDLAVTMASGLTLPTAPTCDTLPLSLGAAGGSPTSLPA